MLSLAAAATVACSDPATAPGFTAPAQPEAVLFREVAVLSMAGERRPEAARSVLVRDGRIAAVGPVEAVAAPEGAHVVEGAGRVLIPGLADLHVHLERLPDPRLLALFLTHGVTTVRNMDGRPFVLEWRRRLVAALHRAGAPILAGTDTPNPFVLPGASLHEELERLVAAGLSPYEALAAATSEAGRFLAGGAGSQAAGQAGTITEGAPADLVLLEASPVEDIAYTRRIAGVMVQGRWLPEGQLRGLLEELARR